LHYSSGFFFFFHCWGWNPGPPTFYTRALTLRYTPTPSPCLAILFPCLFAHSNMREKSAFRTPHSSLPGTPWEVEMRRIAV
jgi:hypothetical protein